MKKLFYVFAVGLAACSSKENNTPQSSEIQSAQTATESVFNSSSCTFYLNPKESVRIAPADTIQNMEECSLLIRGTALYWYGAQPGGKLDGQISYVNQNGQQQTCRALSLTENSTDFPKGYEQVFWWDGFGSDSYEKALAYELWIDQFLVDDCNTDSSKNEAQKR